MAELRPPPPKPPAPRAEPPASPSGQRKIKFPISYSPIVSRPRHVSTLPDFHTIDD